MAKNDRPCSFAFELYQEDNNLDETLEALSRNEYPFVYALHDKDTFEDGSPKKAHYHFEVRVPGGQSLSAFKKTIGVKYAEPLKSWEGYAVYLIHADEKSKAAGKYSYPVDILQGTMVEDAKRVIAKALGNKQKSKHEDDKGILQIIDFIESVDYISTAALVRWACQEGLYSVYRRSGRIIADILAEHNRSCEFTLKDTYYRMKLDEMERRVSAAEKELERAYGDLYNRVTNPFNGKSVAENEVYEASIRELNRGIEKIIKGA